MYTLGEHAPEQAGCLPEPSEQYPRVKLRMNYPVAVHRAGGGGQVTTSCTPLQDVTMELANVRKNLNRARVERCKERREFESELRGCKESIKRGHRELDKRLYHAEAMASSMQRELKETRWRAKSWRREAHEQGEEVKRLRAALEEARASDKRHLNEATAASSMLAVQARKVDKLQNKLEDEKNAYRMRSGQQHEMKKALKDNINLKEAVEQSERELSAMAEARAADRERVESLQSQLEISEKARQSLRQGLFNEARKAIKSAKEAELAELQTAAEQEKVADLTGELLMVREHADTLAKAASALTVPKFRDVEKDDMSYRTKCRAHWEDTQYLKTIFTERTWRGSDIATALHETDLLPQVFDSSQVSCIVSMLCAALAAQSAEQYSARPLLAGMGSPLDVDLGADGPAQLHQMVCHRDGRCDDRELLELQRPGQIQACALARVFKGPRQVYAPCLVCCPTRCAPCQTAIQAASRAYSRHAPRPDRVPQIPGRAQD